MAKSFLKDFESSEERMNAWSDGKINSKQRRVLYSIWLGDAWEAIQKTRVIETAFKNCDFANDIHGRENDLVKIRTLVTYKVPQKGQEKMKKLSKEVVKDLQKKEGKAKSLKRKEMKAKREERRNSKRSG